MYAKIASNIPTALIDAETDYMDILMLLNGQMSVHPNIEHHDMDKAVQSDYMDFFYQFIL